MAGTYTVTEDVALTIILHASKHPSCTVNGVLLGKPREGGGYSITVALPLFHRSHVLAPCVEAALAQAEAVAQQQGLALAGYYHGDYRFGPSELGPLAKRIADRMAERQPATCVLLLDNQKLAAFSGAAAAKAGDAAAGGGGGGAGSSGGSGGGPLDLLLRDTQTAGVKGGAWRKAQQRAPQQQQQDVGGGGDATAVAAGPSAAVPVEGAGGWEAVRKRYLNLFAAGRHRGLVDFDEHLDDVSRDYLNPGLLAGSELLAR